MDAEYVNEGGGQGKLALINRGTVSVRNVDIRWPPGDPGLSVLGQALPIASLPAGKHVRIPALKSFGGGLTTHTTITVVGETEDGEAVEQEAFINLI